MADNLQAFKVAASELSSSTKQNNMVQAIEDGLNSIDNTNISVAAGIDVSKIAALWQAFTPVWASSGTQPVLGNGTLTAEYLQIGKWVNYRGLLIPGTTTTFGTGSYTLTLPVTAVADTQAINAGGVMSLLQDTSIPANHPGWALISSATQLAIWTINNGTGAHNLFAATQPFTLAQTDQVRWFLIYEAA